MSNEISESLRTAVVKRAAGRCEYCLIHETDAAFPHQVDHILSRKHGGSSTADNLAYACIVCNRYKGADIASVDPRTGELVRLFDPRQDRWNDHFRFRGAAIEPASIVGEATARLLRLNAAERVAERRILQSLGRYPK